MLWALSTFWRVRANFHTKNLCWSQCLLSRSYFQPCYSFCSVFHKLNMKLGADVLFLKCAVFYVYRNWKWGNIYVYLMRHFTTDTWYNFIPSRKWLGRLSYQHLSVEVCASSFLQCVYFVITNLSPTCGALNFWVRLSVVSHELEVGPYCRPNRFWLMDLLWHLRNTSKSTCRV